MLPLLHDQLRIGLFPNRVMMARVGKGWHPRTLENHIIPCASEPAGQHRWSASVAVLTNALQELNTGPADATLILSNHFAKYLLTPSWSSQLSNDKETAAYIRHCFRKVYGEPADNWSICIGTERSDKLAVASAVDTALLEAIRESIKPTKLRLRSIQPYLMAAFNHLRTQFKNASAWFLLAEQGKLCISLFDHGEWLSLRTMNIDDKWLEDIPHILEREKYLSDLQNASHEVFLYAPDHTDALTIDSGEWEIHRLIQPAQPGMQLSSEAQIGINI